MSLADSTLTICNTALAHLKSGVEIGDFNNDTTQEAKTARRFYVLARDEAFGDFAWNFCTKTAALTLVSTNATTKWVYGYTYPADCVMARRIVSVVASSDLDFNSTIPSNALVQIGMIHTPKQDTQQSAIPFEVQAGILYTDQQNANLEYTFRNTDETTWPAKFVVGFSYLLASYLAPRLTGGDPYGLQQKTLAMAEKKLAEAKSHSANERLRIQPLSEFSRDR